METPVRFGMAGPALLLALGAVISLAAGHILADRLEDGVVTAFMTVGLLAILLGRLRSNQRWSASGASLFLLALLIPRATGLGATCAECAVSEPRALLAVGATALLLRQIARPCRRP
jgi:drug/metabolite transporter (DMT)-like permease